MAQAAAQLLIESSDLSDKLIARWFGHKIDFGQV
jgi:hypothetical protein